MLALWFNQCRNVLVQAETCMRMRENYCMCVTLVWETRVLLEPKSIFSDYVNLATETETNFQWECWVYSLCQLTCQLMCILFPVFGRTFNRWYHQSRCERSDRPILGPFCQSKGPTGAKRRLLRPALNSPTISCLCWSPWVFQNCFSNAFSRN